MQVIRCTDLIRLNIICIHIETVLSLIRANWMLWLMGAVSELAPLVAALQPDDGQLRAETCCCYSFSTYVI